MDLQAKINDALFMAAWNEHTQRTGHDPFGCSEYGPMKHWTCDVCVSLRRYKDAMDEEMAAKHEAQRPQDGSRGPK